MIAPFHHSPLAMSARGFFTRTGVFVAFGLALVCSSVLLATGIVKVAGKSAKVGRYHI